MKTMKRIIFATAALILVLAMLGVGTLAYFTSTKTSYTNSFTTGTLNLQLANEGGVYGDSVTGTWTSPANWAPGQSFMATLYLKNAGSVDAQVVYLNWTNLQGYVALANQIEVLSIQDSVPCTVPGCVGGSYGDNYVANFLPYMDNNPHDGKLSLAELMAYGDYRDPAQRPWDSKLTSGPDPSTPPAVLPAGGTIGMRFTFKLMENTDDSFQGRSCSIDLTLMATQHPLW
jgi:predicted ribosomally synthesized peptide with SipW-like signal peptide